MDTDILTWWPPAVAARRLGVSAPRVKQLAEGGQLRAVLTPLGHLIDPESVEQLCREREERSRPKVETS